MLLFSVCKMIRAKGENLLVLSMFRHYLTLNTDISAFSFIIHYVPSLVFTRAEMDICRFAALPPISLSVHSSSHFAETGNVAASDQAGELSFGGLHIFLCGLQSVLEARLHDAFQLVVDFFGGP